MCFDVSVSAVVGHIELTNGDRVSSPGGAALLVRRTNLALSRDALRSPDWPTHAPFVALGE